MFALMTMLISLSVGQAPPMSANDYSTLTQALIARERALIVEMQDLAALARAYSNTKNLGESAVALDLHDAARTAQLILREQGILAGLAAGMNCGTDRALVAATLSQQAGYGVEDIAMALKGITNALAISDRPAVVNAATKLRDTLRVVQAELAARSTK